MYSDQMYSYHWPSIYDENNNIVSNLDELFPPRHIPESDIRFKQEDAINISFFNPRDNQCVIAPGRDFYVTGAFISKNGIPDDAHLEILLLRNQEVVRRVFCKRKDDREHLYLGNPAWFIPSNKKSASEVTPEDIEIVRNSCVPDLVYDAKDDDIVKHGKVPPSLFDTWNKAYFTDTFFAAIIYAGEFGNDKNYIHENDLKVNQYDEYGDKIRPLEQGDYVVRVTLLTNDNFPIASIGKKITIGHLKKKALGAFTDADSISRMWEHDGPNDGEHWTILWDPFPGSWVRPMITFTDAALRKSEIRDDNHPDRQTNMFSFLTNWSRVNYCDACEYRGGEIHLVNYALRAKSNSVRIEMAEVFLQKTRDKNSISLVSHYYDGGYPYAKGLPIINPRDPEEIARGRKCNLIEQGTDYDLVFLTSVDISNGKNNSRFIENDAYDYDDSNETRETAYKHYLYEYKFYKTMIPITKGQLVRLNGVCMFPKNQFPSIRDNSGGFLDVNSIDYIVYNISDLYNSRTFDNIRKRVGLIERDKVDKGTWEEDATRIMEFKHVFDLFGIRESYKIPDSEKALRIIPEKVITKKNETIDINSNGALFLLR